MSKMQVSLMLAVCLIALSAVGQGQAKQKPGLWEETVTMSMGGASAPQLPPGVQLPPGMQMPQIPPQTMQVCVTQAMIDKYGGPYSRPSKGNCTMTNVVMTPTGMTANMVCTGQMNATGTVQTTFVDANTTKTTVHMTGTMQTGSTTSPIDMTMQSTSTYKGPDCGNVKPLAMPPSQ
jgi:hypothetical protein